MHSFYRSIFCACVLLMLCKIGSDIQNRQRITSEDLIGWMAQPSGEEDSKEVEDDDVDGDLAPIFTHSLSPTATARPEVFHFCGHIQEVVPPPPQS